MPAPTTAREVHLLRRPVGQPTPADFAVVEAPVRAPGDGEVVVANQFLSVDPYMRGRMSDAPSSATPYAVGEVMSGGAVGTVVASRAPGLAEGAVVTHQLGWRECAVLPAAQCSPVDVTAAPASAYLGVLGMPGMTAYVGLTEIGGLREGDAVFVSGAAGAVGGLAGQYARRLGASRVIGSAGSPAKVAHLTGALGFDAAFDYHGGPVAELLAAAAPDGIDVYYDNVGGEHLEAAIGSLRDFGRVICCGAISAYNDVAPPPGPANLGLVASKRLTLRGFSGSDHGALAGEFRRVVSSWLAAGEIRADETVVDGIDHAVDAFLGLFRGDNLGKMVVRLDGA
jgi:NADPH-dependent curcumin reductase CurA